jgi:hypothetical protein
MQINGLAHHADRDRLDHNRLRVDQLGLREAAYVEPTVEAGLADADRYADVCSERGSGCRSRHSRE